MSFSLRQHGRGDTGLPRVIAIGGLTATGKTGLGVLVAKEADGEVVSCDSMQIYRGMTIGTAAPAAGETDGVPHHMVGVIDPVTPFSVADYCEMAAPVVADVLRRGKTPVIVGGTGLYMDCLLSGMTFFDGPDTGEIRAELMTRPQQELWERLLELDRQAAQKIHPANKKRVIRALEVILTTGETMTDREARQAAAPPPYDVVKICLDMEDREALRRRCDARVDAMLGAGLLHEVEELLKIPGIRAGTAIQGIGYKELTAYFDGQKSLADAVSDIKTATKQYSKRQRSWFKRDERAIWYFADIIQNAAIIDDMRRQKLL